MKNWVLGNWKMNHTLEEIDSFFSGLKDLNPSANVVAGIAPQALHTKHCLESKPSSLKIGAQNCHYESKGAFTGETSVNSLKDIGVEFILIGHSERRALFNEDHELLKKKLNKTLEHNLLAVYCVGETLEQRESGKTWDIIESQLNEVLKGLSSANNLLIAYEPVWAIGTGKTATAEQAGQVHSQIRTWLESHFSTDASDIPILYGGSVKPENFASLLATDNICGGLVGGASLKAQSFLELCKIAGN